MACPITFEPECNPAAPVVESCHDEVSFVMGDDTVHTDERLACWNADLGIQMNFQLLFCMVCK
jgi:hypothetical protein